MRRQRQTIGGESSCKGAGECAVLAHTDGRLMPTPKKTKPTVQSDPNPCKPTKPRQPAAYTTPPEYMLSDPPISPQHVMLKISDLMERYGCGHTTACAEVNEPDFPGTVAPRTWRLDHVMACEDARAWAGRVFPDTAAPVHAVGVEVSRAVADHSTPQAHSTKASVRWPVARLPPT